MPAYTAEVVILNKYITVIYTITPFLCLPHVDHSSISSLFLLSTHLRHPASLTSLTSSCPISAYHDTRILTHLALQFAQELLSTFSTDLGEVALVPGVGGVFAIELFHSSEALPAATPAALGASAAPSTASDGDGRPREKGGHTDESSYGSGSSAADQQRARVKRHLLWDRKRDGGFPGWPLLHLQF